MKSYALSSVAVLAVVFGLFAAPVAEKDALTAAKSFVCSDPVGSAIFRGKTVSGVRDADGLWIVSLSPSGHIILSSSDLVEPIVGFSPTDFADPDPESPACAVLDGARATSLVAETSGAGTRHEKWAKLLEQKSRVSLLAAPVEPQPEAIIVPLFLLSHYNQIQPYNDFCPVYDSNANIEKYWAYRGRSPCGCIATSAAQMFRYFKWPARIDKTFQYDHRFTDTNEVETTFPIRFDGHVPIDWNALNDDYLSVVTNFYSGGYGWWTEYDMRGIVAESVRYPIARLLLWADVMAQMAFAWDSSGADYEYAVPKLLDWYTRGKWVDVTDRRVQADIAAGIPVHVSIGESHSIVGHGWASDGENSYIYLNYGWGGTNDGYYAINDSVLDYSFDSNGVYVGHYPRAKPQLDPLPKVCGQDVTLNWHFPDIYNNNLSGFTIAVSKTAETPTTFLDDFSDSEGVSTSEGIYVGMDSYGEDGNLLYTTAKEKGTFTFPGSFTLTSASVLTFRLLSFSAFGAVYEVQASFNGNDWVTVSTPTLKTDWGSSGWSTEHVYLGEYGGTSARFRIRNARNNSSYYVAGKILLDNFQVTNVLQQEAPRMYEVTAVERNIALTQLDAGASYTFTVTPHISDAIVDGEPSDSISVVVAGEHRAPIPGEQSASFSSTPAVAWDTVTLTDLGTPAILSVSNVVNGVAAYPVREGFYRECRYGAVTEFDVVCSEHVENLNAYSSHLALVGERQVTTQVIGPQTFRVSVDASDIGEAQSRSRMILTLEAIDANGTKAYKDLSLRFSEEGEAPPVGPLEVTTSSLPGATNGVPYSVTLEAVGGVTPYTWSTEISEYDSESCLTKSFSEIGTMTWQDQDEDYTGELVLTLPFDFPFYGSTYRNVHVNPNGALTFGSFLTHSDSYNPSVETLRSTAMIAAQWDDLVASIYVESSTPESVTIRWSGVYYWYRSDAVSFSATLYSNGEVRLSYGNGNFYGGMVGVSSGNGNDYVLMSECNSGSKGNAYDIVFTPRVPLPGGLSLSPVGVISGTPTTSGVFSFPVFVTDDAGTRVGRTFNLTVEQPVAPLEIVTSVLPPATSGVPYSVTLEATGGAGTYYWIGGDAYGYDSHSQSGSSFDGTVGTATGWNDDDGCWSLALPFDFPFYGVTYSNVWVSSNGILTFGESYVNSWYPSDGNLVAKKMIAVLWQDLDTRVGDIYVESCSSEAVTIRWNGAYRNDLSASVSFSAALHSNGVVRLSYGNGNIHGGWIGVSSGNEPFYTLAAECSSESTTNSMNNAHDIVFTPWSPVPEWLSLSIEEGVLSGTPTTPGTISFRANVMDVGEMNVTEVGKTFTLAIEPAAATETLNTPVPVPYSWLDGYASSFASPIDGSVPNYEDLAQKPTGKCNADGSPMRLWQEFVAGTNPTNENDVFTAFIEMVDSRPVVRWKPDLNSNGLYAARSYTIFGKTNLADTAWQCPTNSAHRFFKVSVELP